MKLKQDEMEKFIVFPQGTALEYLKAGIPYEDIEEFEEFKEELDLAFRKSLKRACIKGVLFCLALTSLAIFCELLAHRFGLN